jgi:hypothetical protein
MAAGNIERGAGHNIMVEMREVPAEMRHPTCTVTGYVYFEFQMKKKI